MGYHGCAFWFVLCWLAASASNGDAQGNQTKKIRLLTMLPYPNSNPLFSPSFAEGLDIVPALDLAAQHVNEKEDFLEGYELELIHIDAGCDVFSTTALAIVRGLFDNNSIVGVVGTACSSSTIAILSTIDTRNRTSYIVVHGAGSPLIDREAYPNSFGTLGSGALYSDVLFAMMNKSDWREVAVLVEGLRPFFVDTLRDFQTSLPQVYPNASILFTIPVYDFFIPLEEIRDRFARVTLVYASANLVQRIMCLALRSGMVYPVYQWVIVAQEGNFNGVAFSYLGTAYNCSGVEILEALNGSFVLNYELRTVDQDRTTISDLSYREYLTQYNDSIMELNSNLESGSETLAVSIFAPYLYDAVWAWAIALDNATKFGNFNVEEYQFNQPNDALIEQFEQVDFEGVSGHIKFNKETGSTGRTIDIFQVFHGRAEIVAQFTDRGIVSNETLLFIEDRFPVGQAVVHPALAISLTFILLVLIVITIVTHVLIVVYRDFKSIKATSPKINHLAYIGIYILAICLAVGIVAYAFELEGQEGHLCQAIFAFFLPWGLTLALGAAIVRTWRLYRIFNHYLNPGKFISEPALFCIVLGFLAIDVVISVTWTVIDPLKLVQVIDDSDPMAPFVDQACSAEYYFIWLGTSSGYHCVLLAVLLVLVCLTRKIRNKAFQTVTLQLLVYGNIVIIGLGGSLYFFSVYQNLNIDISFAIFGIVILSLMFLYVLCVFVPPVLPLIKQKWQDGGYEMTLTTSRGKIISQSSM